MELEKAGPGIPRGMIENISESTQERGGVPTFLIPLWHAEVFENLFCRNVLSFPTVGGDTVQIARPPVAGILGSHRARLTDKVARSPTILKGVIQERVDLVLIFDYIFHG